MAETKRGRLAVKALAADTDEVVYLATAGNDATVDICVANIGAAPATVSIAVVDGGAVDLADEDYIRGRSVIEVGGAIEIKGLKMSDGESLIANSNRPGVSVRVSGFEEAVVV